MTFLRAFAVFSVCILLAACSSGPPKRVFPPQATVQELRVQPDGQIAATLRVQNFSTVPMTFNRVQATLTLAGAEAARFDFDPALTVGPGSNELVTRPFAPTPAVKSTLDAAFAGSRPVRYTLEGRIADSTGRDDAFKYDSALDPVPGLTGVLR